MSELGNAFVHVLSAPFRDLSVFWQLVPIFIVLIVLGGYFVYWKEELGWNSALTNAITLMWVLFTALQVIFGNDALFSWTKFSVFLLQLMYCFLLLYIVFKHKIKSKWVFILANPLFIHYQGMMVILWAHGLITSTLINFVAVILLFVLLATLHELLGLFFGKDKASQSASSYSSTTFEKHSPGYHAKTQDRHSNGHPAVHDAIPPSFAREIAQANEGLHHGVARPLAPARDPFHNPRKSVAHHRRGL